MECAVECWALPSRVGQVRRIVTAQLRYWRLAALVEPVALGVTELLANVYQHAGPDKRCTLELTRRHDQLTVSVRDSNPRLPRMCAADSAATTGRGLALVAAVSQSWGMRPERDGSGKTVWFALPTAAAATPPAPLEHAPHRERRGHAPAVPGERVDAEPVRGEPVTSGAAG